MRQTAVSRGRAFSPRLSSRRSRGVADIVATILMVLIVVVLAAVLFILVRGDTGGAASTPGLSTALALGTPAEAVSRTATIAGCTASVCNFYNMSVQTAAHGLELHDLAFEVIGQNGSTLLPPGGVVALNALGAVVGQYTYTTGWSSGSATDVTSSVTVVLYTSGATPASLSGDELRIIGVAAYSGSIAVHIF